MFTTYRCSHFRIWRVLLNKSLIDNSLFLNIFRVEGAVDGVELLIVKEGIPSVLFAEVLELPGGVSGSVLANFAFAGVRNGPLDEAEAVLETHCSFAGWLAPSLLKNKKIKK